MLGRTVAAASDRVEGYLRRSGCIELKERTEIISATLGQRKFYLPAYPVTAVESVEYDASGLFAGDETAITDFQITETRAVVIPSGIPFVAPNSVRIVYTGGLAEHAVNSVWVKTADTGGTLSVGKYIQGATSLAIGIIRAVAPTSITYECLSGVFQAEGVTEYGTYTCNTSGGVLSGLTGVSSNLTTRTKASLAESHAALVEGVEMFIRVSRSRLGSLGKTTVTTENDAWLSPSSLSKDVFSVPEVRDYLTDYMNRMVV